MAYADDVTVVVRRNEPERLFEILDWFSKRTQFKLNQDNCEIIADFEIASWNMKRNSNVLGVEVRDKMEGKEKTLQRSCELTLISKKFFNKFMSLRGVAKTSMTFVIPKLKHNLTRCSIAKKGSCYLTKVSPNISMGPRSKN